MVNQGLGAKKKNYLGVLFQFYKMKKFKIPFAPTWECTQQYLKVVKMVNLMLCGFNRQKMICGGLSERLYPGSNGFELAERECCLHGFWPRLSLCLQLDFFFFGLAT
jgi:hypothetical protein